MDRPIAKIRRRLLTVPAEIIFTVLLWLLSPILLVVALAIDLFRGIRRLSTVRLVVLVLWLDAIEFSSLILSTAVWVFTGGGRVIGTSRWDRVHEWIFAYWINGVMRALTVAAGLRMKISNETAVAPGPTIMIARHTSYADAPLPAWFLIRADMTMHYSLTQELLWLPCMDIVGLRQTHRFVDRSGANSAAEIALLEALVSDMDTRTAAVIFPEGRFHTPERGELALAKVAERTPARLGRVRPLEHMMPVLPGGVLAYLRGTPDADVVLVRHVGFEPFASLRSAVANIPFEVPAQIHCERYPRSELPVNDEERLAWLDERWLEIDRWVDEHRVSKENAAL